MIQNDAYKPLLHRKIVFSSNKIINIRGGASMKKPKNILEEIEQELSQDIYNEVMIENYTDDDIISPAEAGFMIGYLGA